MQIATTWDIIGLTSHERLFGGMVEMAVLAAAPGGIERLASDKLRRAARTLAPTGEEAVVDAFVGSLCAGSRKDDHWRQELAARMDAMAEARLRAILADLCVESGLVHDIRGRSGPVIRRLDAILDLAQVSFSAADVRAVFASLAADLTAAPPANLRAGQTPPASLDAKAAGAAALERYAGGRAPRAAAGEPGADALAYARLLNAVLGAVDCGLPGLCDVLAVRAELHGYTHAATGEGAVQLGWALGFVTAAALGSPAAEA